MLIGKLSDNNLWIQLSGNPDELDRVKEDFTKKMNSWFIIKKKYPNANVEESFINKYNLIPVGLWVELINSCKRNGINLQFEDTFVERTTLSFLTRQEYDSFVDDLFKNSEISLKGYQKESVYNMVHYKNCCVEISTSGGKTLISYVLFRLLKDKLGKKHILFVSPNTNLTTQSADKYIQYDSDLGVSTDWTFSEVHSKTKKKQEYDDNIVFGNFQSLCRKKDEFFKKFDAVIVDEAHHSQSSSIRTILKKCVNAEFKIGMTGTFPENGSYDSFVIQAYIGPVVYRLSSYELINEEKFATNVFVSIFALDYLDNEKKRALYTLRSDPEKSKNPELGGRLFKEEQEIMRTNQDRFRYVCSVISKTTKNSLVLFSDIQNEYGRNIYNFLKDHTSKQVFYIDGNIDTSVRSKMIEAMENDLTGNTIIVGSMPCFSEGIDIGNLWNIFLVETTKSEKTVAQILGRGMRRFEGKTQTNMIDFVDDYRFGEKSDKNRKNYLFKHGMERAAMYINRGFPCKMFNIKINKES